MEKVEKVTISVAVVLFDIKVHSNSVPKKFKRSRSFGDLDQRSLVICLSNFQRTSPQKLPGQFQLYFICSL